jgi:ferritin-like metal-binding protein YciE
LDAGLLAVAQSVEHYEISRYGTLKMWAESWGTQTLPRSSTRRWTKKNTDAALSELAETVINQIAEAKAA